MSDAKKPLLFSDDYAARFDPKNQVGDLDPGRLEGWSEIVQANDLNKADDLAFREAHNGLTKEHFFKLVGSGPRALKLDFMWLPCSGVAGGAISPNGARQLDYYTSREGFIPATQELLDAEGIKLPPTATVSADGLIRRGFDVALYVRSGEVARKWERYKAEMALAAEGAKLPEEFAEGGYAVPTFREREEKQTVHIRH